MLPPKIIGAPAAADMRRITFAFSPVHVSGNFGFYGGNEVFSGRKFSCFDDLMADIIIKLIIFYPRRLSVIIFPEASGGRFVSIFSAIIGWRMVSLIPAAS